MADQAREGLLSPFLRSQRLAAARPHLRGRILDLGCGSGALAGLVGPDDYEGIEMDGPSLARACILFPKHRFHAALLAPSVKFDTIVSLAVIEHVPAPADFLQAMAARLTDAPLARIVITTPLPLADWWHGAGARLGLFSRQAHDEHGDLLDRPALAALGQRAGLTLVAYSRFLCGANQLALFAREPT
jgi:2-polyprenyl-3-methyl-5-hydroxy-6-metoxy-1,4-benzoquinol methylase